MSFCNSNASILNGLRICWLQLHPLNCPGLYLMVNKSANALALCHPPSASFCSVLAVQWSSRIFTHDRNNIPSDILIEFKVNLGITMFY